jgi:hypothetical protein
MNDRIKTLLSILAIFLMGVFAGACLFDGMARTQEVREMRHGMKHCSVVGTGQHCWLEGEKELVVITARGAK